MCNNGPLIYMDGTHMVVLENYNVYIIMMSVCLVVDVCVFMRSSIFLSLV